MNESQIAGISLCVALIGIAIAHALDLLLQFLSVRIAKKPVKPAVFHCRCGHENPGDAVYCSQCQRQIFRGSTKVEYVLKVHGICKGNGCDECNQTGSIKEEFVEYNW